MVPRVKDVGDLVPEIGVDLAMYRERDPLPQRRMQPDLVERSEEALVHPANVALCLEALETLLAEADTQVPDSRPRRCWLRICPLPLRHLPEHTVTNGITPRSRDVRRRMQR